MKDVIEPTALYQFTGEQSTLPPFSHGSPWHIPRIEKLPSYPRGNTHEQSVTKYKFLQKFWKSQEGIEWGLQLVRFLRITTYSDRRTFPFPIDHRNQCPTYGPFYDMV